MTEIINFILDAVAGWGYSGIFLLMMVESSFIPFPSEVIMIPAGYLAQKGEMSLVLVILSGTVGSLLGAYVNYYLAYFVGRRFLHNYGKYFFIKEATLDKAEAFFRTHGSFSTFFGRLIPVIRQLISIPAGLAKMNLARFTLYTSAGAGIWVVVLAFMGYFIGHNEELIKEYMSFIVMAVLGFVVICGVVYYYFRIKNYKN